MKLEKWALLAEICSAIAVVLSLIFVGLQVRQGTAQTALNTRAIEVSAYQELTAQIASLNTLQIQNPRLSVLRGRALDGGEPDSYEDRLLLEAFFRIAYRHGDMAFRQFENELIDEQTLDSMLAPVYGYARTSTGQDLWRRMSSLLNSGFKRYVDERIQSSPAEP